MLELVLAVERKDLQKHVRMKIYEAKQSSDEVCIIIQKIPLNKQKSRV